MFGQDEMAKLQEILGVVEALKPLGAPILDQIFDVGKMVIEGFDRSGIQQFTTDMQKKKFDQLLAAGFSRQEALILMTHSKTLAAQMQGANKLPPVNLKKVKDNPQA